MSIFFGIVTVITIVICLISYHHNPFKVRNGVLLIILAFSFVLLLVGISFDYKIDWIQSLVVFAFILLCLLVGFGAIFFIFFLFYNSIKLIRREGKALSNFLSLILLCLIVLQMIIPISNLSIMNIKLVNTIYMIITGIEFYLILVALAYLISSAMVLIFRQIRPVDYIIVLGCGLLHGDEVSPLLASRIRAAFKIFRKAPYRTKLIMSGGQGNDELVPEACAMKKYALGLGVDSNSILVEDKSKNTLENMQNSKSIIESRQKKYKVAFATNGFHVFRAGTYAYEVGLRAKAIPARTKLYFSQNALIREYLALLVYYKKMHMIIIIAIVIAAIVLFGFIR